MDEQLEAQRILSSFLDACANRDSTGNIKLPDDCGKLLVPDFGKYDGWGEGRWGNTEGIHNVLVDAMHELVRGRDGDFQQLTGFSPRLSDVRMVIAPVRELQCQVFTKTLDWYQSCVRHVASGLDLLRLKMLSRHIVRIVESCSPFRVIGHPELYVPIEDGSERDPEAWRFAYACNVLVLTAQYYEATAYLGNLASMIDSWQRYWCGAANLSHASADDASKSIGARRAWLEFHSMTVGEYVFDLNNDLEGFGLIPTIFCMEVNAPENDPRHRLRTTMHSEDSRFRDKVVTVESFNRVSKEIFQCPELADLFFRGDGRVVTSPDRADKVAGKLREFVAENSLHQEFVLVPLPLQL